MTSTLIRPQDSDNPKYRAITLHNIAKLPQAERLTKDQRFAIDVVSRVLPFKTNNYVVDELINWDNVPNDPIFTLTFPQQDMLSGEHFEEMASLVSKEASRPEIEEAANRIRLTLNPHPAGQLEHNVPVLYEESIEGLQHKYEETVLLFPSNGQTCHAYCTFCFRWPQFVGIDDLKFATKQAEGLISYLRERPRVSDVLITGGDPMVMKTRRFKQYIEPILEEDPPNLRTIRIGTKALGYWPYRFTTDDDAEEMLDIFRRITASGRHLSIMAHFNHPMELSTPAVREATERIRETGAQIRTQSPIMRNINGQLRGVGGDVARAGAAGNDPVLHVRGTRHGREALLRDSAGAGVGDLPRRHQPGERARAHRARAEHVGGARQGGRPRTGRRSRPEGARADVPAGPEPGLGRPPVLRAVRRVGDLAERAAAGLRRGEVLLRGRARAALL